MTAAADGWKRAAAEAAVALVEDGMVVGLGTGSTAAFAVAALGERVAREGLRVVGIPTSERTAAQARGLGIPLTSFAEHQRLDLTIDGADEIEPRRLDLIKGLGGALLREKIVASAGDRLVIIADEGKLVGRLGERTPVPVEVVTFGWEVTARRLGDLGARATRRTGADGAPFVTDGGNYVLDCAFGPIEDPAGLEARLARTVGVVESGLFVGLATEAIVAGADGVRTIRRGSPG